MNKTKSLKLLISIMSVLLCTVKAYGYAEAEQPISTAVQPSVSIEKQSTSIEAATADAQTGTHTGLQSVFSIQTNGDDEDYDFIVTSKILTEGGEVSAYGNNGCILFGNTFTTPTAEAIENAKNGGNMNKNVIAYPVTTAITEPMTVDFEQNYGLYGDCYVVKVNGSSEGTLTHTVGQTPVSGTYNIGQDPAGTYQTVVTFTAISK